MRSPRPGAVVRSADPVLGRERATRSTEDPRGLGREYVPPARISAGDPSATSHRALPHQDHALGERGDELGVSVATIIAGRPRRGRASSAVSASLCRRSIPRVGSSRHVTAGRSPSSTIASARRCCSPPERSRGWRAENALEPGGGERRGGHSSRDALVDGVVARVLEQQRDPPAAPDLAAGRLVQPRREPEQRRLAGAVPAEQRDPVPWRDLELDTAEHAGPRSSSCHTRRGADRGPFGAPRRGGVGPPRRWAGPARAVIAGLGRRRRPRGRRPGSGARPSPRRALARDRPARPRAPGVCSSAARSHAQSRNSPGAASHATRRRASRRRGRRRPGTARAGARRGSRAAPHSSLSRRSSRAVRRRRTGRAARSARRAAPGAAAGQRCAERDPLQLATGELCVERSSSGAIPSASAASSTARATAAAPRPGSRAGRRARREPCSSRPASRDPGTACPRPRDPAGACLRVSSRPDSSGR